MKRGEIYLCKTEGKGNVQKGFRPVIVVQNDIGNLYSPTTIVCCITSANKKWLPTHAFLGKNGGLAKESIALCEQIFTVNKTDLMFHVGTVTNNRTLKRLEKCLSLSLGIKGEHQHA